MMNIPSVTGPITIVLGLLLFACTFADDERCTSGYDYDPEGHTCVPVEEDAETDEPQQSDTSSASTPDDTDETGLGKACTVEGNECQDLEASYCALNPVTQTGYCTYEGCTSDPGTCPEGYTCCDMPFAGIPNFCATKEDAELMGSSQCRKP